MADGSTKPIEAIRVGDLVRSHDGDGFGSACVTRTYSGTARQLVRIAVAGGRVLLSTPEHVHFARPPLVDSRNRALAARRDPTGTVLVHPDVVCGLPTCRADAVDVGMWMLTGAGVFDRVVSVEFLEVDARVHDLEIEGTHNFVANGIVTHNSIYKFRGADYRNLMRFEEQFPEATIIVLDQNYRSTQHILDAANAVIANNAARKPKHLWTEQVGG